MTSLLSLASRAPSAAVRVYSSSEYLRRCGYRIDGDWRLPEPEHVQERKPVTVAEIQRVVAARFKIDPDHMKSGCRAREMARPRQIAMYLSRKLTVRSMPDIGRRFGGRDHSTVIHAIRNIEKLRLVDPELDQVVDDLERELAG